MPYFTPQDAMIMDTAAAAGDELLFTEKITLNDAKDFVLCMYTTVNMLSFEGERLKEHIRECTDDECNAHSKMHLKELYHKRDCLVTRLKHFAPRVIYRQEQLEAKVAEKLELL